MIQEDVEGVFNQTWYVYIFGPKIGTTNNYDSMIGYPNYKFYFPIMALGSYQNMYIPKLKKHNEEAYWPWAQQVNCASHIKFLGNFIDYE